MHLGRIQDRLREAGADCIVLTDKYNILYALGVEAPGYVFITPEDVDILVPRFHIHDFEGHDIETVFSKEEYEAALDSRKEKYNGKIVTDAEDSDTLDKKFGAETTDLMDELRQVKTDEEIGRVKRACKASDKAFDELRERLFDGLTEREAVSIIQEVFRKEKVQDGFITDGGQSLVQANCLQPHRVPREQVIEPEDLVIVDLGARFNQYCSDVTRTYCQNPAEKQLELFETVKQIQEELLDLIEPGLEVSAVQERELELVEEHGYKPDRHVLHATGHGVGLEVHERPALSRSSEGAFKEGMVLAVEPALYVSGVGGCRIEDTVLVTSGGVERLSRAPRQL